MKHHRLAFIDTETTGLSADAHELIEIGGIIAEPIFNGDGVAKKIRRLEEFEIKIVPEHIENAEPKALEINGYTKEKWKDAITLPDAMRVFAEKTANCVLVGQNVSFDWAFLEIAFERTGVTNRMHYHRIDLMSMAYAKLYDDPELQRFSLKELCAYFKVENKKAHAALSDIRATFEVYKKLLGIEEMQKSSQSGSLF